MDNEQIIEEYGQIEPDMTEGALPSQEQQPEPDVAEEPKQPVVEGDENVEPPKDNAAWAAMRVKQKDLQDRLKAYEQPAEPQEEEPEQTDPLLQELLEWTPGSQYPTSQIDPNDPMAEHIKAAQASAQQARQEVAAMKAEMEKLQAVEQFPALKTDKIFRQSVEDRLLSLTLRAQQEGKARPTMAQVAKKIDAEFSQYRSSAQTQARSEAEQTLQTKQAATLSQTGSSGVSRPQTDNTQQQRRINKGDETALVDALMEHELAGIPDSFFNQL